MTSRPPSRIGFFLPDLNFGGVERITFELGRAIAERGTAVDLVLARAVGTASDAVPAVFRTVDLGATRTVSAIPPLSRYLRKEGPAALVSAKDHANVVAVIAQMVCRAPLSVIATVHSRPSETLGNPERWTGHAVRRVVPYAYSRAAGVVAVSQGVADDVARIAPRARVRVIPNPVVTPELLSARERNPSHPWFARDRSFKTIVWCGRLAAAKDPFSAVDAIAELRRTVDARLVFVGDGPLRRELVQHVEQAGLDDAVDVVGYVEDPSSFIDKADALLFSSRGREGLPTVIVEALALHTPVVATDCESGPREILAGGAHGILVPVGDVTRMSAALALTLTSGRPELPEDALDPYHAATAADSYLEFIDAVSA